MASETASKSAMEHGLKTVEVTVKGPGPGRESLFVHYNGLEVTQSETLLQYLTTVVVHQNVVAYNFY